MAMKAAAAAPSPRLSMRETIQRKIFDEIVGNSASASKWKILIMDETTTRIISSCLTMFEVMEQQVSLVENLNLGRQSFPDLDAVYFITPTMESVRKIMGDFISPARAQELPHVDGKPVKPACRYGNVHLIFNGSVGRDVIETLQSNTLLIGKVKTFKEVHLDFLSLENSVYHFDSKDALSQMYGRVANTAYPSLISRKLASLCIMLNEHPNIRFQQSSAIAREIAGNVHRILTEYKTRNPTHLVHGDDAANSDRERGQLLILDRTFDPLSPLMHEYTYQAMANDLLDVSDQGMVTYQVDTGNGTQTKETFLNSEADELWKEFRHKHIAKVISSLKERMDDILSTNPGAKLTKKGKEGMDMSAMAAAVKSLPEYQQMMSNHGRHVALATQCMAAFGALNLMKFSLIEQTLSTGVDEDGKQVKGRAAFDLAMEAITELAALEASKRDMAQKAKVYYTKIRLLAIFLISQIPVSSDDRRQLIRAANLNGTEQQVLLNLESLMGPLDNAAQQAASTSSAAASKGGFFSRLLGGMRQVEKIAATAEGEYTDTRHVCQLKLLLDQLCQGSLPFDKFPATGPALPGGGESKQTAVSVRKYKVAADRWGGGKANSQTVGGRILVFVAGGISYAEMREGYDITAAQGREVVVGSTHIITPTQYVNDIEGLDS